MLVRALRVTDRLGNAALRIGAWLAAALVEQAAGLRRALFAVGETAARLLIAVALAIAGVVRGLAGLRERPAQLAGEAAQGLGVRRRELMAQRAAEAELKPAIAKDPLLAQNRALSAFAVLLLLVLLAVLVIQNTGENESEFPAGGGGWPQAADTPLPTALFPTPEPTPTPLPDPLRAGGSIAFTLRENGQEDIWVINVGESGPLRLTNSPADDRDPAWSPDGTRLAFVSHRDGNWELYIMQVDTGATTRLTYTPGFEGAPTWSPDGAFLAYEGYNDETQDLDIYIISSDPERAAREGAFRATFTPGPDTEPDWGPGGRHIAFTSWRDGSRDIFIMSLDADGGDARAINLTNTPDVDEDHPAWSHDGSSIAYTARVEGVEGVYVKPAQQPDAVPILVGRGRMPTWAPNDGSVLYALDFQQRSQLITGTIGTFGAATDALTLDYRAADPHWNAAPLPASLVVSGGVPPDPTYQPLYSENERLQATGRYGLAPLNNVQAPQAYLSDRVNDSFEALRIRVLEKVGYDFLGTLEDAFWPQGRLPDPGEPRQNWHYTGRAFAIDRTLVYAPAPAPIEVVREDQEISTYWRVFVRVVDEAQTGTLGEPLRDLPWDFAARSSGDVTDYEQGGRRRNLPPPGYYVDLTQLAEDFGWERLPAQRTWQYNFGAIQFWTFVKTGGLSWEAAMLELYTAEELQGFLSAATQVPPPPPLPTESPTPAVRRTPTPIPPDQQ